MKYLSSKGYILWYREGGWHIFIASTLLQNAEWPTWLRVTYYVVRFEKFALYIELLGDIANHTQLHVDLILFQAYQ